MYVVCCGASALLSATGADGANASEDGQDSDALHRAADPADEGEANRKGLRKQTLGS